MCNMSYKTKFILLISVSVLFTSCFLNKSKQQKDDKQKHKVALITTSFGDIKLKLYDKTPLHRNNFVKLAEEGFYDSLLFHRVIKNFMIQGGDPDSRNAKPGQVLGNGGPGYTIPAEFDTSLFHKKGALAAAREGDVVNPERRSSGSQFYIVQGRVFTNQELDRLEQRMNQQAKNTFLREYIYKHPEVKAKIDSLNKIKDRKSLNELFKSIQIKLKPELDSVSHFKFSKRQREAYTTIGGAPHLDGAYTVFGEVIEGLNVVDSIANVKTGKNDRPLKDVIFSIKIVDE